MKKIVAMLLASLILLSAAAGVAEGSLSGGWNVAENTAITEENKAILEKALEKLVGVTYEPIAYLGSQVVAGLNHCFLCKATVVYPDAVPSLALVYIYEDLSGNAQITNIADFDIAELSVPAEPVE